MIEPQQSAEPLSALQGMAGVQIGRWRTREETIAEALVVTLEKIMIDKLRNGIPKMLLTKRHASVKTLGANRADEALSVSNNAPRIRVNGLEQASFMAFEAKRPGFAQGQPRADE